MKNLKCEKSKKEILDIIISEFEKVNQEYSSALQDERAFGKYIAMIELLEKLQIYDN